MKGLKETNNKIDGNEKPMADDQADRRSKAYSKIVGDQPTYISEEIEKRNNYR